MHERYIIIFKELIGMILVLLYKLSFFARHNRLLSIYFHNPNPKLFESIIKHLTVRGYKFISLDQFYDMILEKRTRIKGVIITLDDGWRNNLSLIEIVKNYKVNITIFVNTSAIEKGNFWWEYVESQEKLNGKKIKKEIIRLKELNVDTFHSEISKIKSNVTLARSSLTKGELFGLSKEPFVTIGSHSDNHISLSNKPTNIQRNELLNSKKTLEMWTGNHIEYFSYPGGDYTKDLMEVAKKCRYKLCFTTETSDINLKKINQYAIPRRCVNDNAGYFEALSKVYGIWYQILRLD